MYASGLARWSRGTVWVVHVLLPRHSPMLRALLCALYTLSLSLSLSFCLLFSPYFPFLLPSCISLYFALSLSSFRSPSLPVRGDTHARNAFSVPLPLSPGPDFPFPSSRHTSLSSFVSRHVSSRI